MIATGPIRALLQPRHEEVALRLAALELPMEAPPREMLTMLGEAGVLGCVVPPEFARESVGPNDSRTLCLVREALGWRSPLADAIFALQGLGSHPLVLAGSQAQRDNWLPGVASGAIMAAFAMTEPEAGSDVASLACAAYPDGDGWRLTGRKTLISNAGIADFYVVFATCDPSARSRGIAAFLVLKEHVILVRDQHPSAPHPLGEIELQAAPGELISREGFKLGMRTLDALRVSVAAAACGMAARALHEARRHALSRRQFGQPLAEFQLIQARLAQMAIGLDASRLLTYRAAWMRDQGETATLEVAMAKAFATETAQQVIDSAMQICGGVGMLREHPVENLYRAIRPLRIYEGTTEIQHLIIARELLKHVDAA